MALGLFMMFIIFIFIVIMALFITGVLFIVFGTGDKKKGGKGKLRIIGIVMVAIPVFLGVCIGGKVFLNKVRIKCVADEWRYNAYFIPRNSITSSYNMLKSMLEAVDEKDKDKIYREFSENVRDDSLFEETVDDFFSDIEKLGVSLDLGDFPPEHGENVHLENPDTAGYIYSSEVDGETYFCYVRICFKNSGDKDDVGLQQFIVCTKDKEDELRRIIKDGDDDIYFEVL